MNDPAAIATIIQNNPTVFPEPVDYDVYAATFNATTVGPNPVPAPQVPKDLGIGDLYQAIDPASAADDFASLGITVDRIKLGNDIAAITNTEPLGNDLATFIDQWELVMGTTNTSITAARALVTNPPLIDDPNHPDQVESQPLWEQQGLAQPVTTVEIQEALIGV